MEILHTVMEMSLIVAQQILLTTLQQANVRAITDIV
jgi:hypothetical protein